MHAPLDDITKLMLVLSETQTQSLKCRSYRWWHIFFFWHRLWSSLQDPNMWYRQLPT